ncbi:hypothetical protein [Tabrizicola sp.]|uniref:hypothetical protein n=1 Tax=Tabrizicola sp. TaxID=2005166 RepID=UPI00286B4031|nr:hypothetical protein [Tabrizicola sp.]
MPVKLAFAVVVACLVLWLAASILRASRQRKAARAGYFDAVAPLFDRVVRRIEPTGFARVTGHIGARAFDLQALPDSLTFRKLPTLWVMITLPEPLPVDATLDIMARPTGHEPFSHFASLPQSLPCPDDFPQGTAIRSDNASEVPPQHLITRHAGVFADPHVKELLVSPKGLRLVLLGDEADRGRYLIFRDAEVGLAPLSPSRLSPLLQSLLTLRDDLLENAGKTR